MTFRILGLAILLISAVSYAQGRKPAVEDFVGIEVNEPDNIPQGTEQLYNLEQDLNKLEAKKRQPQVQRSPSVSSTTWSTSTLFVIALMAGLPILIWVMLMSHLKKKAYVESASNIEVLEKHRKAREKRVLEKSRKAS